MKNTYLITSLHGKLNIKYGTLNILSDLCARFYYANISISLGGIRGAPFFAHDAVEHSVHFDGYGHFAWEKGITPQYLVSSPSFHPYFFLSDGYSDTGTWA